MGSNNKGSMTVEATLVIPIMIFFLLAMYHIGQLILVENLIYNAGAKATEETALFCYNMQTENADIVVPTLLKTSFLNNIDNENQVNRYIKAGINGVSFNKSYIDRTNNELVVVLEYQSNIIVPFFNELVGNQRENYLLKTYIGDTPSSSQEEADIYVYITDNQSVYHNSRMCTHLLLSIQQVNKEDVVDDYEECEFCNNDMGDLVYITNTGNKYHSSITCSGLKRTVTRIKKSEVNGLGECSRCAY